jgi:hypothetical protein
MKVPLPLMYAVVVVYAVIAVALALWIAGRAFDHMTDPCRTESARAVAPACISR